MSNWIDVNNKLPDVGAYCQVLDKNGVISHAIYTFDAEDGNTLDSRYFAGIDSLVCKDGAYSHDEQYGETINVIRYALMPRPLIEVDEVSKKFWADMAERNKVMRAVSERRNKDYDWFDNCKPDE